MNQTNLNTMLLVVILSVLSLNIGRHGSDFKRSEIVKTRLWTPKHAESV